jgi:serine/threonine protein phosphatase PrpC
MNQPFIIEGFSCPKAGNTPEEYEDAFTYREIGTGGKYRVAIADGATETSFSQLWAALLVENYTRNEIPVDQYFKQLESVRRLWSQRISKDPLPWYAAEKATHGAYAAFLGLEIDASSKKWRAISVGDCCLFHINSPGIEARLIDLFPMTNSSQFTFSPNLICSLSEEQDPAIEIAEGTLREGDVLFLATDALSAWFLKRYEERKPLWNYLAKKLKGEEGFSRLASYAHKNGLHNDDLTLVRIIFSENN